MEYSGEEESSESTQEEEQYFPPGDRSLNLAQYAGVTEIQPSYWNGYRWKVCMNGPNGTQIAKSLNYKEITVISWNVWFGLRNRAQRIQMLGKVVAEHDPDFIFFQEVTAEIIKQIVTQKWAKQYYISDPEANLVRRYGNVMLSKIKFHECVIKDMPSLMGRKMILGSVVVKKSPKLTFGTFHLESDSKSANTRSTQLLDFKNATKDNSCIFLIGDTNFASESEMDTIKDKFLDAWPVLYPNDPGLTFDTETNGMAKQEYEDQGILEPKRKRLDRCFYTPETIEPISMQLLGTSPYYMDEYISDHYGLLVKLRLKGEY